MANDDVKVLYEHHHRDRTTAVQMKDKEFFKKDPSLVIAFQQDSNLACAVGEIDEEAVMWLFTH